MRASHDQNRWTVTVLDADNRQGQPTIRRPVHRVWQSNEIAVLAWRVEIERRRQFGR